MGLVDWIDLPTFGDDRGSLAVIESSTTIPFDIRRVYYIYGAREGASRGFHAHKQLRQVAICLSGKCRMLLDNGVESESVWMSSADKGLYVDRMVWHEMHEFSPGCVLLMLASDHYDEADYIRGYEDFLEEIK